MSASRALATAKRAVHALGFTLSVRNGEYRLAPLVGTPAEQEAQAHYTNDLLDAIGTAKLEYQRTTESPL
jgi:hypothetical protein